MDSSEGAVSPNRRDARLPLTFSSGGTLATAETTEVSLCGVFVRTEKPLRERKLVHLLFDLPGGQTVDVHGMVEEMLDVEAAKAKGAAPGMAIRFYGLGMRAQALWEAFVRSSNEAHEESARDKEEVEEQVSKESVLVDESYIDEVERVKAIASEPTKLLERKAVNKEVDTPEDSGHAPKGDQDAVFCIKLASLEALEDFSTSALGSGGLHMSVPRHLSEGQQVVVRVIHPTSGHEFHIPGEVVETTPPKPGVNVKFIEVTDHTREAFQRFISCAAARSDASELSLSDEHAAMPQRTSEWAIENTFELSMKELSSVDD